MLAKILRGIAGRWAVFRFAKAASACRPPRSSHAAKVKTAVAINAINIVTAPSFRAINNIGIAGMNNILARAPTGSTLGCSNLMCLAGSLGAGLARGLNSSSNFWAISYKPPKMPVVTPNISTIKTAYATF